MNNKLNFKIFTSFDEKKSLMLKEKELWVSSQPIDNSYTFEKEINSTSQIKIAKSIKFKSVEKFKINSLDNRITIHYKTILGKNKSQNFTFSDSGELELVKTKLLSELNFTGKNQKEQITTPLLKYGMPLVIILTVIILLNLSGGEGEVDVRGRNSLLKLIYNTVGLTGFTIIGALVSSVFAFLLGKRILNPAQEIIYES